MGSSNHACVNTKILAMKAKMLNSSDYSTLIKASTLQEVFTYLRDNTYYGPFLAEVDHSHLHRLELEVPLNRMKIFEIEKMLHYLQGDEKRFLKTFLVRADIEALRILIRGIARGDNLEDFSHLLVYSENFTQVDFDKLLKVKDWDSFKKVLIGTDYYRLLEVYKQVTVEEDLFPIEKSLERYYYDRLKNRLESLDKRKNKKLITTVREGIDLLNLVWFYRGKRFYHLSREELLAYSLRGGLRVKETEVRYLSEIKDVETLREVMKNYSEYDFLFNHTKTLDLYMERRRERYLYYAYQRLFMDNEAGLGKVVAFVRLAEFEIADIITIIESKRYRMTSAETEKYLIRSLE
ncbi:MAG: V-type ATPase subunit [Eubacterium sp.]